MTEQKVRLRAIEMSDVEFLYSCENATDVWAEGSQLGFVSKGTLSRYIESSFQPVQELGQIRFIIESLEGERVGIIDLSEINWVHRNAHLGILILDIANRGQGYGASALSQMVDYARHTLHLVSLQAQVRHANQPSQKLFLSAGWDLSGILPLWVERPEGGREDLYLFTKSLTG